MQKKQRRSKVGWVWLGAAGLGNGCMTVCL
jgi:hypothetical protein